MEITRRGFVAGMLLLPIGVYASEAFDGVALPKEETTSVSVTINGKELTPQEYEVKGSTLKLKGPFSPNATGELHILVFYAEKVEPAANVRVPRTHRSRSYFHVVKATPERFPVSIEVDKNGLALVTYK